MTRTGRIAATVLAAGTLLGAAALPAAADDSPQRPHRGAVLTAVQYGASHRQNLNDEWVKVANTSNRDLDLDGYTLSDREGHTYTFHHLRLRPGSDVVVHTGHGHDSWRDVYQNANRLLYNNRGTITLSSDRGRQTDSCSWERSDGGFKDCTRH